MRTSELTRNTKETKIFCKLNIDGQGKANINTKVGFFDHMLELFAFHGGFDLEIVCDGDIEVDSHHTVEDVAIVLGSCLKEALGDKRGITRYGNMSLVMDEAFVHCSLDISNRPFLVFNAELPASRLGNYEIEMTEEFFRAFAFQAGITLHINEQYGSNTHHIIEAMFKSCARALKQAIAIDDNNKDKVISSKGVL